MNKETYEEFWPDKGQEASAYPGTVIVKHISSS